LGRGIRGFRGIVCFQAFNRLFVSRSFRVRSSDPKGRNRDLGPDLDDRYIIADDSENVDLLFFFLFLRWRRERGHQLHVDPGGAPIRSPAADSNLSLGPVDLLAHW
jgi:hypothetical protein